MSKRQVKIGVGQLTLTFDFLSKDAVEETQDNGPAASEASSDVGQKPKRKLKWHSLIDKVYALPNLEAAWKQVAENNGAAGADGVTIRAFRSGVEQRLLDLSEDLRRKTYRPMGVRRVFIPKGGGGQRPLGIPTIRDRIVQQALLQILQPIFEAKFSKRSHGFRPERGCSTAIAVVDQAIRHGYEWVVDADIQSFFDTVDHEILLTAVNEEVADGSVLRLIRRILQAGVYLPETSKLEPTEVGTPQGGPLSPILANIYLHAFDTCISQAGYGLVRYADDFVIFAKSEDEAVAAHQLALSFLEGKLGLQLHPEKTRVVSVAEGFEFLGFHYFRHPKTGVQCKGVRRKSVKRFRDAIRQRTPRLLTQSRVKARNVTLTRLQNNERVEAMVSDLNRYLRGWHWYFKGIQLPYKQPFDGFDRFVRQRIRSAIVGRTGAGWWQVRINNTVLRTLGLLSVEELQWKYHKGEIGPPIRKG